MTIDCDNDGLFDKRSDRLTLNLSNVRLVRFDAGHGGCRLFSVNDGLLVHAKNTDFVGGFGSSPGNGNIFDGVDVMIGHFEDCSFTGINDDLFRSVRNESAMLWMDNCKFDRKPKSDGNVKFENCIFDAPALLPDWTAKDE